MSISYTLPKYITLEHPIGPQRTIGQAFEAIFNWDATHVRQSLLADNVIASECVDEAIVEFRKFLMCIVLSRVIPVGSVGMVSKTIDEVWHNSILFTQEYFELSAEILGEGCYLHHAPAMQGNEFASPSKNSFPALYEHLFGRIPAIWGVQYENDSLIWQDAVQGLCLADDYSLSCFTIGDIISCFVDC